jgi:hypothetical protein
VLHAARQLPAWLIFDVRPQFLGMRGAGESSRQRDRNRWSGDACVDQVRFAGVFRRRQKGPATRVTLRGKLDIGSRRKVWEKSGEMFPDARCHAMRALNLNPSVPARDVSLPIACVVVLSRTPNQAPEPTPTSDTPRAFSRGMKWKRRIADRVPARGAPDAVVAHL